MPAANSMSIKRETLNLRIKPAERDLIDRAAKARGKNRTDFVLDLRIGHNDALLNQRFLSGSAGGLQHKVCAVFPSGFRRPINKIAFGRFNAQI